MREYRRHWHEEIPREELYRGLRSALLMVYPKTLVGKLSDGDLGRIDAIATGEREGALKTEPTGEDQCRSPLSTTAPNSPP